MAILLAVNVGLLDNWKDYVEGPKYGNATKPETRRAKEEQWELTAATRAFDNPLAITVQSALAIDSLNIHAVITLQDHETFCNYVATHAEDGHVFIGFNIYRNVKIAAIDRLRQQKNFPAEYLDMSHLRPNLRLVDPLKLIMSGFSSVIDESLVCKRLGIPGTPDSLHSEMDRLIQFSHQLKLL